MKAHPRISIVTPSLNQGQFIEQAIQSVLSQNYPDLEYLVMDGGSTDRTLGVLEKYSNSLRWVSEKDQGQAGAINKGLRAATGDILAYLNADDLLMPDALMTVAATFTGRPEAMWLTGQCYVTDEANNEIRRPITVYKNILLRLRSRKMLLITNFISQPATFWRKSALASVGLLDENLRYVMDYEYWLRLYSEYPPVFVPKYLAAFKIHSTSKTTSTGHKGAYVDEESGVIRRHAHSDTSVFLHHAHRFLMTAAYSLMNRGG